MFRQIMAILGAVLLSLIVFGGPAGATPSDGNGNKFIESFTFDFPVDCGDSALEVILDFTVQVRERENGGNVFLNTYIVDSTYSNDAGETWVFRDRGADRGYLVDGVLNISIIGRSGFGNIGHVIIIPQDDAPPEVIFQKGQPINPDAEACARLG